LVAANDEVLASLKARKPVSWVVPKGAKGGDLCILSHWGLGLYAWAHLDNDAQPIEERRGKYAANLVDVVPFQQAVPLSVVASEFPEWKWPTYPRSYTTVGDDLEADLWDYVQTFITEPEIEIDESVSAEGRVSVRVHRVRERDPDLIDRKKAAVLKSAKALACEVCSFDFRLFYGAHGDGFAEVHHLRPLAWRAMNEATSLADLAIVCANCHRMLHRKGLIELSALRRMVLACRKGKGAA
jgi:predicted HNH restriction endonuclease